VTFEVEKGQYYSEFSNINMCNLQLSHFLAFLPQLPLTKRLFPQLISKKYSDVIQRKKIRFLLMTKHHRYDVEESFPLVKADWPGFLVTQVVFNMD